MLRTDKALAGQEVDCAETAPKMAMAVAKLSLATASLGLTLLITVNTPLPRQRAHSAKPRQPLGHSSLRLAWLHAAMPSCSLMLVQSASHCSSTCLPGDGRGSVGKSQLLASTAWLHLAGSVP